MAANSTQQRMRQWIDKYYLLNRVPVGDDTTMLARELARDTGADLLSFSSGTPCLTWVVPDKWTVREAYIETMDGRRIADLNWHPLYVISCSAAFTGIVSREQLLEHIFVHPSDEDRLTYYARWQYQFNAGERTDWGFCLPGAVVKRLTDDRYRVHIDAEFTSGTMDIVDWTLPGESGDTVFFSAHTCHPGQVNDGIGCIALLVELFRYLQSVPDRKFTYRMIVGPEYYAAAAILQYGRNTDRLKYGLYLDMMGTPDPLGFSRSFDGNSYIDLAARNVLKHHTADWIEAPYRELYGNDEMFYDGPGFEIPTLGMCRWNYQYYHTELDNPDNCDFDAMEQSLDVLKQIVDIFETDCVPARTYKGPLYLSKYGMYIDPNKDIKGYNSLQAIQIMMDGKRSCLEIAEALDVDYRFVRSFTDELCKHELAVRYPVRHRERAGAQSNERDAVRVAQLI